jgi:hypothetical protein
MSTVLEAELLSHLEVQIVSARRLLASVLAQGKAIRSRDVDGVLARLGDIQAEMGRRGQLEIARTQLLTDAGRALGLAPSHVTLEALCTLVTPGAAAEARARSAQLRGLLAEIAREHGINRALMRQELTFLSHLIRQLGNEPEGGYGAGGTAPGVFGAPGAHARPVPAAIHRVLDLQA